MQGMALLDKSAGRDNAEQHDNSRQANDGHDLDRRDNDINRD